MYVLYICIYIYIYVCIASCSWAGHGACARVRARARAPSAPAEYREFSDVAFEDVGFENSLIIIGRSSTTEADMGEGS